MPLIAAASISIDFAMFCGFVLLFGVILALAYLCRLARAAVRRVCMNDDDRDVPRRRTRLRAAPIEHHA